jgi:DNA-binding MurR/RpiR family transcriptional regulator
MKTNQLQIADRIRDKYGSLPSSERVLADLIVEFPGDIAIFSATDLAVRAKASNAAVSRLIKRLGYKDYRDAQRQVRKAQAAGEPIYLNSSMVLPTTHDDSLRAHIDQDLQNLTNTFESISADGLNEAVKTVVKARKIWVIGFRNSYFFASYIRRQLIQARSDVIILPLAGQVIMEDLAEANPSDVLIAVGMRRRVPVLRKVMEALHARKVPIVYFADRRAIATTKLATWNFPCHTRGISLFDSYVGLISLLNFFCTEVAAQSGNKGRKKLKNIETLMLETKEIDTHN